MRIKVLSVIKSQDPDLGRLEKEYLARIRRHFPCDVAEFRREKIVREASQGGRILREEARRLLAHLKENAVLAVLDRQGQELDSEALAVWLQARENEGLAELVFVLGGPLGLAEEVTARARWRLSLSRLTFPHKLARVILLEALYRSCEILKGSHYAK